MLCCFFFPTRHLLAFRGPPRGPGSPCPWLPSQGSWAAPPLCPTAVPSYSRLGILLKCKPLPCSKPWNNSFLPVQPLVTSQTSFHTIPAPGRLHLMLPLPGYSLLHIFMATSFIHISAKCHLPAGLLGHWTNTTEMCYIPVTFLVLITTTIVEDVNWRIWVAGVWILCNIFLQSCFLILFQNKKLKTKKHNENKQKKPLNLKNLES